jgi:hypothetical protein
MIFISHNNLDKPIVEPIALRLREVFGQEKVFYDSWSIQPGEGIIDKMDEGLRNCQFFFFFVSKNSLNSKMVKLEWQNALIKANTAGMKFIPIRLDESIMPAILLQSLYIDLFQNGKEVCLRQMIDTINGQNIFRPQSTTVSNLIAIKSIVGKEITIECRALYYLEPIPRFVFATLNSIDEIEFEAIDKSMFFSDFIPNINFNGKIFNGCLLGFRDNILPNFPQAARFFQKKDSPIDIIGVYHPKEKNYYVPIPLISN